MGDVTGPISTLPGHKHVVPAGATCDDHPDRPAVARIQGETDSFGSELVDLCQQCLDAYDKHREEAVKAPETCEWCGAVTTDCAHTRDVDEGAAGPVYMACRACRQKQSDYVSEELSLLESQLDDDFEEEHHGECELCKAETELFPTRYADEGFSGDYHLICRGCRQKQTKQDLEDLDELLDRDDDPA